MSSPFSRPEVFVIRANDIAFMGLLRSVAASGSVAVPVVYTWENAPNWISPHSRHFKNKRVIPNPASDELGSVEALKALGRESILRTGRKPLVLPSSDTVLMLFLNHEDVLGDVFDLMGDRNYASYRAEITHKGSFFDVLTKNCPELCPNTRHCSRKADVKGIVSETKFPCIVKPAVKDYAQSFYTRHGGSKALTVSGPQQLQALLMELIEAGFDLLVQEKIIFDSGKDEVPFYAFVDGTGQIKGAATGVKEFLQPAPFGTATVLRLSWHPELLSLAQQVVDAIKWRGTLMIEFINDLKDGCWKVVEVNTRPWLFQDFYRQCGIPFVVQAIIDHADGPSSDVSSPVFPAEHMLNDISAIHVDLPTIASSVLATEAALALSSGQRIDLLLDFIREFSPYYSSAHGSLDDAVPLRKMLSDIAATHDLDESRLTADFTAGLTDLPLLSMTTH